MCVADSVLEHPQRTLSESVSCQPNLLVLNKNLLEKDSLDDKFLSTRNAAEIDRFDGLLVNRHTLFGDDNPTVLFGTLCELDTR